MNTIHDTAKKHPNFVNYGSTLKSENRLFQPYFKPSVEPVQSKASKNVLSTKNPERHIDKILNPIKEKIANRSDETPPPPTATTTTTTATASKKRKKTVKKPPTVSKKSKKAFSIFDGHHV